MTKSFISAVLERGCSIQPNTNFSLIPDRFQEGICEYKDRNFSTVASSVSIAEAGPGVSPGRHWHWLLGAAKELKSK